MKLVLTPTDTFFFRNHKAMNAGADFLPADFSLLDPALCTEPSVVLTSTQRATLPHLLQVVMRNSLSGWALPQATASLP